MVIEDRLESMGVCGSLGAAQLCSQGTQQKTASSRMVESWRGKNPEAVRESPRRKPSVVAGMETPPRGGKKMFLIHHTTIRKRTTGHHDFLSSLTGLAHPSSCPLFTPWYSLAASRKGPDPPTPPVATKIGATC